MGHAPTPYDDTYEFIELKNTGNITLNLAGIYFNWGIQLSFPENTEVLSRQFVLLVKNKTVMNIVCNQTDSLAWSDAIILEYKGSLKNNGELIVMKDNEGKNILEVVYKSVWYPTTNGAGYSLVPNFENKSKFMNSFRTSKDFRPG